MKLWHRRVHLPADGDVTTPAPVIPPYVPLRDRDRYRLPLDIAWVLLRLP